MFLQPVDLVRVVKLVAPFSQLGGHGMLQLKTVYFFIEDSMLRADWGRPDNAAALVDLVCWLTEDRSPERRRFAHYQLMHPLARAAAWLLDAGALSAQQVAKLAWAYGHASGASPTEAPLWPAVIRFVGAHLDTIGVADLCRVLYALAERRHAAPESAAVAAAAAAAGDAPAEQLAAAGAATGGGHGSHAQQNELFTAAASRITLGVLDGSLVLSSLDCATLAAAYTVAGVPAPELMACLAHRATCAMLEHLPMPPTMLDWLWRASEARSASGDGGGGAARWWMADRWSLTRYLSPRGGGGGDDAAGGEGADDAAPLASAPSPGGADTAPLYLGGGVTASLYHQVASARSTADSAELANRLTVLQRKIMQVSARGGARGDHGVGHDSSSSFEEEDGSSSRGGSGGGGGGGGGATRASSSLSSLSAAGDAGGFRAGPWREGAPSSSGSAPAAAHHIGGGSIGSPPHAPPSHPARLAPPVSDVDARAWVMLAWSLAMQRAWTVGEGAAPPPVAPVAQAARGAAGGGGRLSGGAAAAAPPPAAARLPPEALAGTGAFFNVFRRLYPRMWKQATANARDVRRLLAVNACLRHLSPFPHLALSGPPAGCGDAGDDELRAAAPTGGGGGSSSLYMGPMPPPQEEGVAVRAGGSHGDAAQGHEQEDAACVTDGPVLYVPEGTVAVAAPLAPPPGDGADGDAERGPARRRGRQPSLPVRWRVVYGASVGDAGADATAAAAVEEGRGGQHSSSGSSSGSSSSSSSSSAVVVRVADPLGHSVLCELPRRSESARVLHAALQRATSQLEREQREQRAMAAAAATEDPDAGGGGGGGGGGGDEGVLPRLLPCYLSAEGHLFDFADPRRKAGVLVVTPRMLRPSRDGLAMAVQTTHAAAVAAGWTVHLVPAFELPRAALHRRAAPAVDGGGEGTGNGAKEAKRREMLRQIDELARRLLLDVAAAAAHDGGGGSESESGAAAAWTAEGGGQALDGGASGSLYYGRQ